MHHGCLSLGWYFFIWAACVLDSEFLFLWFNEDSISWLGFAWLVCSRTSKMEASYWLVSNFAISYPFYVMIIRLGSLLFILFLTFVFKNKNLLIKFEGILEVTFNPWIVKSSLKINFDCRTLHLFIHIDLVWFSD